MKQKKDTRVGHKKHEKMKTNEDPTRKWKKKRKTMRTPQKNDQNIHTMKRKWGHKNQWQKMKNKLNKLNN